MWVRISGSRACSTVPSVKPISGKGFSSAQPRETSRICARSSSDTSSIATLRISIPSRAAWLRAVLTSCQVLPRNSKPANEITASSPICRVRHCGTAAVPELVGDRVPAHRPARVAGRICGTPPPQSAHRSAGPTGSPSTIATPDTGRYPIATSPVPVGPRGQARPGPLPAQRPAAVPSQHRWHGVGRRRSPSGVGRGSTPRTGRAAAARPTRRPRSSPTGRRRGRPPARAVSRAPTQHRAAQHLRQPMRGIHAQRRAGQRQRDPPGARRSAAVATASAEQVTTNGPGRQPHRPASAIADQQRPESPPSRPYRRSWCPPAWSGDERHRRPAERHGAEHRRCPPSARQAAADRLRDRPRRWRVAPGRRARRGNRGSRSPRSGAVDADDSAPVTAGTEGQHDRGQR